MKYVAGIDLGTTHTCVAIVKDGVAQVIADKAGLLTTPSVVTVTRGGKRLVGHVAKRQSLINPTNTVASAKRLIGQKWGTPETRALAEQCHFRLVEGRYGDVRVRLRDHVYSVPELSAYLLREMKLLAEQFVGAPVEHAVLTVPAHFNDNQRQATRDAARIAGLGVLRIINEPTAAAVAFGAGKELEQRIVVYDLGGGTFDVSVVEVSRGVFEVISTAGETFLGGDDLDARVVEYLVDHVQQTHGVAIRSEQIVMQRIRDAAERARCELSVRTAVEIKIPHLYVLPSGESLHIDETLTIEELESLTEDLIDRTIEICKQTLERAQLTVDAIDQVVLVGGVTQMPLVVRRVTELFGREPATGYDPSHVVALGAGIHAAATVSPNEELCLLDVASHSIGVMVRGGYFMRLIERNTAIPTEASHTFTTTHDGQTSVKILVLQGEYERAADNELLGEFVLSGIRPAAQGKVEIEVVVSISHDGIVSVSARELRAEREGEAEVTSRIEVTNSSGLSRAEIEALARESQNYLMQARTTEEFELECSKTNRMIAAVRALLPEVEDIMFDSLFGREMLSKTQSIIDKATPAMQRGDMQQLRDIRESLERALGMFLQVVTKSGRGPQRL